MLFPQQNHFRSIHDLSGYWRFQPDPADTGERDGWPVQALPEGWMLIAVPGAWNEQLAERGLKNYVGSGWYETQFVSPRLDRTSQRLLLRVNAADHHARVWLNGDLVGSHQGGYLPFELDLTDALGKDGTNNRLVICVDSRLTMETLPQGIDPDVSPYDDVTYDRRHVFPSTRFDFFPYGGLTRSVQLLTVPASRVTSIAVRSSLSGTVELAVGFTGTPGAGTVAIHDACGVRVAGPVPLVFGDESARCTVDIPDPHPLVSCDATSLFGGGLTSGCLRDGNRHLRRVVRYSRDHDRRGYAPSERRTAVSCGIREA